MKIASYEFKNIHHLDKTILLVPHLYNNGNQGSGKGVIILNRKCLDIHENNLMNISIIFSNVFLIIQVFFYTVHQMILVMIAGKGIGHVARMIRLRWHHIYQNCRNYLKKDEITYLNQFALSHLVFFLWESGTGRLLTWASQFMWQKRWHWIAETSSYFSFHQQCSMEILEHKKYPDLHQTANGSQRACIIVNKPEQNGWCFCRWHFKMPFLQKKPFCIMIPVSWFHAGTPCRCYDSK